MSDERVCFAGGERHLKPLPDLVLGDDTIPHICTLHGELVRRIWVDRIATPEDWEAASRVLT